VGILQAILQAMLQGAGPVVYYLKVLKGIISAGCCARCLVGVLFLDPRSWILWLLLRGRFVPGSSFLDIVVTASWAFCSWILVPWYYTYCLLGVLFLVPGYYACYLLGVLFLALAFLFLSVLLLVPGVLFLGPRSVPGIAGSWALLAPGVAGS
jgi:hypothetical protein